MRPCLRDTNLTRYCSSREHRAQNPALQQPTGIYQPIAANLNLALVIRQRPPDSDYSTATLISHSTPSLPKRQSHHQSQHKAHCTNTIAPNYHHRRRRTEVSINSDCALNPPCWPSKWNHGYGTASCCSYPSADCTYRLPAPSDPQNANNIPIKVYQGAWLWAPSQNSRPMSM